MNAKLKASLLAMLSLSFVIAISNNSFTQNTSQKSLLRKDFESQRAQILKGPKEMKAELAEVQKDIKARNLKFKVELNEMMKYQIADITGASTPSNIEQEAQVKFNFNNKMWDKYKKKYSHLFKKEENYFENNDDNIDINKDKEKNNNKKADNNIIPIENTEKKKNIIENETDIINPPSPSMSAFNWRDQNKVTSVKYQGSCGSCWAFTAAAVVEANYYIKRNTVIDVSEQNILDCAESRGNDAGSCNGGWYGPVFDYLIGNNTVDEQSVPYKTKESVCSSMSKQKYKIALWGYVKRDAGIPNINEMKTALCKYGPLASTIKVTPAFQAYKSGIFDENAVVSSPRDINHAIVIVGWDDSKRSYLVKNSWGERWGDNGYIWVEYGCNNIGYGSAWLVVEPQ